MMDCYAQILNPLIKEEKVRIDMLASSKEVSVFDRIDDQIKDLIKCRQPKIKFGNQTALYQPFIEEYLKGRSTFDVGCWVYYSWNKNLVHVLPKDEFIEVRTNRNRYKITRDEQQRLGLKKIGVVGLSVGQSVAVTLAQERTCGEIRLADFDTLELSNLNRIRTPIWNVGVNKAEMVAREIAEIDPFIKVTVYNEGLQETNMDDFFLRDGKLDLLVEECDGLDIKILARIKAKELQIPVVMETNDRCMVDIERYDQDENYPILHGLVKDLSVEELKSLKSNEDKVPIVLKLIGIDQTSTRLRASMLEVEQSIVTWPQLASTVASGGGILTSYIRRILLGSGSASGRFYHDYEQSLEPPTKIDTSAHQLDEQSVDYNQVAESLQVANPPFFKPSSKQINSIMDDCMFAPSAANNQPWHWIFKHGILYLFHNEQRSRSFWDRRHLGAGLSLGCALKTLELSAEHIGLDCIIEKHPENLGNSYQPVASIRFNQSNHPNLNEDYQAIRSRRTNRSNQVSKPILDAELQTLNQSFANSEAKVLMVLDEERKSKLGKLLGRMEQIRLLNPDGHRDFVNEIRWEDADVESLKDGIDIHSVDLTKSELAGLNVSRDPAVMAYLNEWNQGSGFVKMISKGVDNCHSVSVLLMPSNNHFDYLEAGKMMQNYWLVGSRLGIDLHPLATVPILFNSLSEYERTNLAELQSIKNIEQEIRTLLEIPSEYKILMIFRQSKYDPQDIDFHRIDKSKVFVEYHG